ncbi:MAG: 2-polyprenyl-6-methoxyphenol hydroxylase-like FAD-dependent oxidoreductase [Bradymonadia bacterium]|jgi:2-polyprenyl-6-methoxyphenol hydroxylase-like FAD-dependent oxidoreductase
MSLPTQVDVTVVGAGPTGLTLACELARRGVRCAVLDARLEPERLSKALGVHARTLEVFEDLDIAEKAVARGRRLSGATIYSDGEQVAQVTLDTLESRHPYVLILPQHETEELLEERLGELGGSVLRGVRAARLRPYPDRVELDVEQNGETSVLSSTWLVGCDGAHSFVRHALDVEFEGAGYAEEFALADLKLDWNRDSNSAHAFLAADGIVAVFPLPEEGRARIVADLEETDTGELTAEFFEEILARRAVGEVQLSELGWTTRFRIHRRIAAQYRSGRCFLAGDAAHVHSPIGGQGMNTGIQDGYNLGWKLASVVLGHVKEDLLESYEVERRPVAQATLRGTDFATRIGMMDQPLARAIRGRVATFLTSFAPVRDRITRTVAELDVNYRRSPIVAEDVDRGSFAGTLGDRIVFARGPKPGDRCPDAPTDDDHGHVHRWLRGTHAILFVFACDPGEAGDASLAAHAIRGATGGNVKPVVVVPDAATQERLRWNGGIIVDTSGEVARLFGAVIGCLYLIRPDGYVAFRADRLDARAVTHYLSGLR